MMMGLGTMTTHEQLATLTTALEAAGWVRLNGNTWQSPGGGTWQLRTAYAHREATLDLRNTKGKRLGSKQRFTYRGAEPLTWAETEAATTFRKIFAK